MYMHLHDCTCVRIYMSIHDEYTHRELSFHSLSVACAVCMAILSALPVAMIVIGE